jgi:hypothetical protein
LHTWRGRMKGERCDAQAFGGLSVCGVAGGTGAAHLVVVGGAGGGAGVRVQVERMMLCVDKAAVGRVIERNSFLVVAEAGELGRHAVPERRSRPVTLEIGGDWLAHLARVPDAGVHRAYRRAARVAQRIKVLALQVEACVGGPVPAAALRDRRLRREGVAGGTAAGATTRAAVVVNFIVANFIVALQACTIDRRHAVHGLDLAHGQKNQERGEQLQLHGGH